MSKAYERAMSVLQTEHEIVDVLFNYIDRMNDPDEDDPLEKSASEFVEAVRQPIKKHLRAVGGVME